MVNTTVPWVEVACLALRLTLMGQYLVVVPLYLQLLSSTPVQLHQILHI